MTNEAIPVNGPYVTQDFTVESGTAIDKGTLCFISGERNAIASGSHSQDVGAFAGIAATDKSITDGDTSTTLGMTRTGIHSLYAGGGSNIPVGALVNLSGENIVEATVAESDILAGEVVGQSLGPAVAIGTPDTIEVDISRT